MSDSLQSAGRQYTRLPLSSIISQSLLEFMSIESVMLTISSLSTFFSFRLQYFPALGSFPMSWLCVLSCSSRVWLCATLWTITCQVPLSMGFSRQEYWSELLFPPPGDLYNSGIKPMSLTSPALAGRFFTISTTWESTIHFINLFTPFLHRYSCLRISLRVWILDSISETLKQSQKSGTSTHFAVWERCIPICFPLLWFFPYLNRISSWYNISEELKKLSLKGGILYDHSWLC